MSELRVPTPGGMGRFGVIWAGFAISFVGTAMARFAIAVQVFLDSDSVTRFALVALVATVPLLALSPLAGVVADRFDRRLVLLTSVFGASLPHIGLWRLAASGTLDPWHIYTLIGLSAAIGAFITPALGAAVPQLVGKQHFARASGLLQTATSLASVIGPLLGGTLLPLIGLANVILLNAVSFFFAVTALLIVRMPPVARGIGAPTPSVTSAADAAPAVNPPAGAGWRFIRERPGLLRLLLLAAAMNFFVGFVQTLLAPLVLSFATPQVLGLVVSLASAGALVGGATVAVSGGPRRRVRTILTVIAAQGCVLMLGSPFESAAVIAIAAFTYLLIFPLSTASSQAIWQTKTPPTLHGRVFAFRAMIAGATLPLAQAMAGPIADHVAGPALAHGGALASTLGRIFGTGDGRGIALMLGASGLSLVVLALVAMRTRSVRDLERDLADAVGGSETAAAPLARPATASAAISAALRRMPAAAGLLALLAPLAAGALAVLGERPPAAVDADASRYVFSARRAARHIEVIAARPHPVGSPAQAAVRDHLRATLEDLGLEVTIQRHDTRVSGFGVASLVTVENVLARLPGTAGSPAVLLAAHYDSVPTSPGAADNGAGVAALLETARALAADVACGRNLRHDVVFLFTDGEEVTLHGARAFVREHPWADQAAVAINLDARGHRGPVYVFQTGEENGWWTRQLFRAAPAPRASSLAIEVFRRLPNRTDFNVLSNAGIPGFDLAMIGGLTHYHTDLDRPEEVSLDSLQHHGSYALALARHLGDLDLTTAPAEPDPTYFNIGSRVVRYPTPLARILALMAAAGAVGLLVLALRRRRLSTFGLMQGILAVLVQLVFVPVVVSLVWMALRDGAHLSMLMGSTPGAERIMLGLALLAVGLTALIADLFRRTAGVVELLAGSVVWWLLALVAVTDLVLAAGASFIALWPLAGGLAALAWLTFRPTDKLGGWVTAAVLAAATIPAFAVVMPLVTGLYPAIQSLAELSGVALVPLVLAVTLLAPGLEAAGRGRSWWPAAACTAAAVALLTVAVVQRGPFRELSSAVFARDDDRDEQHWFSFDPQPTAWTEPIGFAADRRARFDRFFAFFTNPLLTRTAAPATVERPQVRMLPSDTATELRFEVVATARSRGRLLAFDPPGAVVTVTIDGTPVSMIGRDGPSRVLMRLPVRPRETVVARLRNPDPLTLILVEQLEGLPPRPSLAARGPAVPARPMLSVVRTDATFVRRSFRIDPTATSPVLDLEPTDTGGGKAQTAAGPSPPSSASTAAAVSSSASDSN